jgi:hypothetical protein
MRKPDDDERPTQAGGGRWSGPGQGAEPGRDSEPTGRGAARDGWGQERRDARGDDARETRWSAGAPAGPHGSGRGERETIIRPRGPEINSAAWFYCQKGPRRGHLYQFRKQRNEFGRAADCDVLIEDEFASAHHGAVLLEEGTWKLFDFASTNGTLVDGKRLGVDAANPVELNDGAVVTIGDTELVFKRV